MNKKSGAPSQTPLTADSFRRFFDFLFLACSCRSAPQNIRQDNNCRE
jgi:hypothetical protein